MDERVMLGIVRGAAVAWFLIFGWAVIAMALQ